MRSVRNDILKALGAILISAQFMPMMIWAANRAEIGFPDGLILWVLLVTGCGMLVWWVLRGLGLPADGATAVAFSVVLGFSSLGISTHGIPGGFMTVTVLLVIVCVLVYRLGRFRPMQWVRSWVLLFVALSPATVAVNAYFTGVAQASPEPTPTLDVAFRDHPDVVLVVFDAHTSLEVLEEHYEVDVASRYEPWRTFGGVVVTDIKANYALTHLSLASVLEMGYPYVHDASVREGDWDHLLAKVSGENAVVRAFKSQGYRYTMVESGWAGFHCATVADNCIRGIWPDQGTRLAMDRSLIGALFQSVLRDTESVGALDSIQWLEDELPALLANHEPDLVLAHLMLPHPPLRLAEDCRYRQLEGLGGTTVASPWFTTEEVDKRVEGYLAATICARDVISDLLQVVGRRGHLVALGDHGSDSQAQLFKTPDEWSSDDLDERFGALFVTNSTCPIEGLHSLVNVGRWLIGCLSEQEPTYLADRFFLGGNSQRNVGANPDPLLEVTDAFRQAD